MSHYKLGRGVPEPPFIAHVEFETQRPIIIDDIVQKRVVLKFKREYFMTPELSGKPIEECLKTMISINAKKRGINPGRVKIIKFGFNNPEE